MEDDCRYIILGMSNDQLMEVLFAAKALVNQKEKGWPKGIELSGTPLVFEIWTVNNAVRQLSFENFILRVIQKGLAAGGQ